jgi:DNA adenine methylase
LGASFAVSKTSSGGGCISRERLYELIDSLSARLDNVTVENLTWQRCLDLYDGPGSLFFLDPPYLHAPTKAYAAWTEADVIELRDRLRAAKGQWILTLDASEHNQAAFGAWPMRFITARAAGNKSLMREILVTSAE